MASRLQNRPPDEPTYFGDHAAWAVRQAELLRAGHLEFLDIEHLAEEISDLAKREFDVLTSALTIVLVHMIKWDYQPWERSRSWYNSIGEHRDRIGQQLRNNPSFKPRMDEALADVWPGIIRRVLLDTRMDKREFPVDCPYDWTEILERPFIWPLP